jgi:hypothetical protein
MTPCYIEDGEVADQADKMAAVSASVGVDVFENAGMSKLVELCRNARTALGSIHSERNSDNGADR